MILKTGRFINADDMYEFDANNVFEHNKYIYAYCNPIGFKDPSGKAPKKKYKVIVLYDKDNFWGQADSERNNFIYGYQGKEESFKK